MNYSPKQIKDIVEWDVYNWSQALPFWDNSVDFCKVNDALEVGARRGGLSLWLALNQVPHIVCSDCEDNTMAAKPVHEKYGFHSVDYTILDAGQLNSKEEYDLICFKSVLGVVGVHNHVQAQKLALDNMFQALKPGGWLVFAENLSGSFWHRALRRHFVKWGKNWRYVTLDELMKWTASYSKVEVKTVGCFGLLGRNETQRRWLGKLDAVLAPLIPKRWNYIAFFSCQK